MDQETVGFVMRRCPKLTSLKLPHSLKELPSDTEYSIQNSIRYAKNLHTLSLNLGYLSKDCICSLVEAKPPLKKLQLKGDLSIVNQYLMMLLQACSSIQELYLVHFHSLSDRSIQEISLHLPKLTQIHLGDCGKLSTNSFFTLTKNCPFLQVIKLPCLWTKVDLVISSTILHKCEKLLQLDLCNCEYLDDKLLKQILSVCPNLQSIDVRECTLLTEEDIQGILKTCVSLTELKVSGLRNVTDIFGKYFEGRTIALKIIDLEDTGINDTAFRKIGNICTGLESLKSSDVTYTAVMEVVRNCKKLKKLNLSGCKDWNIKLLRKLVSKSFIKRLVPPENLGFLSEDETKRFRNNGCKICYF